MAFGLIAIATGGCLLTADLDALTAGATPNASDSGDSGDGGDSGLADGATNGGTDARDAATTCDPDKPFETPTPFTTLNTAAYEGGPRLSPDELTMYFESDRAGGPGESDLYVVTRPSLSAPFGAPSLVANVSQASDEYTATVTPDGLTLAFASNRSGDFALFLAKRPSPNVSFSTPVEIASLETASTEAHPAFTLAGDALYFTSTRPGGAGDYDLYRATYDGGDINGFGPATRIVELAGPTAEITPVLSADELTIIFSREGPTKSELWKARRSSRAAPWQAPQRMTELDAASDVYAGWMSIDGCRLYIYSREPGANLDLSVAMRSP